MSSVADLQGPRKERDLNRYQVGLVDTCFEEGQYETGIAMIAAQRSPSYKPSAAHIRQLIYIALYPGAAPSVHLDKSKGKANDTFDSPSMFELPKPKSSLHPTSAATRAAQRVLMDFEISNSADALLRALPNYDNKDAFSKALDSMDEDSFIAKQSIKLLSSPNCWALLKEDAVQRQEEPKSPMKKKSRKRPVQDIEERDGDVESYTNPSVVGPNSWFLLEWLLRVFEKDQKQSNTGHATNLISQIPPNGAAHGPRTDASAILEIVFFCLSQTELWKASYGIRLLNMVINLSSSPSFDARNTRRDMSVRLSDLSPDRLDLVLASIPTTEVCSRFRIALCMDCLTDLGGQPNELAGRARPRPQARPRPVFVSTSTPQTAPTDPSLVAAPPLHTAFSSMPSPSEVLGLLASAHTASAEETFKSTLKFDLVKNIGMLNFHKDTSEKNEEWLTVLKNGCLVRAIESAFPVQSADGLAECLLHLVKSWECSV